MLQECEADCGKVVDLESESLYVVSELSQCLCEECFMLFQNCKEFLNEKGVR